MLLDMAKICACAVVNLVTWREIALQRALTANEKLMTMTPSTWSRPMPLKLSSTWMMMMEIKVMKMWQFKMVEHPPSWEAPSRSASS